MSLRHATVIGLVSSLIFSTTAFGQEWRPFRAQCADRSFALSYLNVTMGQFPVVQGVTHVDQFAELFADDQGNWTFAVTIGLETCMVASGTDLQSGTPRLPEERPES